MKYLLASFFFLGFANLVFAANSGDVIINEIAWMGTEVSYNDEWIELRNNSGQEINLDGWVLRASDGTPTIKLTKNDIVNGFYLLERSKNYTGALENSGEALELYDNLGNLVDSVDASSSWPAGDNTTKQTMERGLTAPGAVNWQNSQNSGGTPMAENSSLPIQKVADVGSPLVSTEVAEARLPQTPETPTTTPPVIADESYEVEPRKIKYPFGIIINEIMPSPIGADEEEEWIEIFNQNNFEVNISGWKISDTIGNLETYTFPEGTTIGAKGFLVLSRPNTKITLNNSGEGLNLIRPDNKIADLAAHEKAPRGQSYNRTDSGWFWSSVLTPGNANVLPAATAEPVTEKPVPQKELAAIGEQIPVSSDTSLLFIVAVFTSIFSGVIILILKHVRT